MLLARDCEARLRQWYAAVLDAAKSRHVERVGASPHGACMCVCG
jgi:hypothetical protein